MGLWGCGAVITSCLSMGLVLGLFKMSKKGVGSAPESQLGSSMGREMRGSYPGAEHHCWGCKMFPLWDGGAGAEPTPLVPAMGEH